MNSYYWYTNAYMATKNFTAGQLIRRSLTPSGMSGFICLTVGFALVLFNVILLSVSFGTALPGLLDGQWAVAYTENIVQPLTSFFTNGALNKFLVAAMWGVVGLTVYTGFEYLIHSYTMIKDAQRTVALNASGSWQQNPMQQYFIQSVLWRAGVLVAAVVFFVAMQPLLKMAMDVAPRIIVSQSLANDALRAVGAALVWAVFWHGLVVLIRLYTRRTRLFGDEKLY